MKRIFIALISLCTIVLAYADGDILEIWNKAQLVAFRNDVNGGNNYSGKTVKLMADITIVEEDHWVPIGKSEQRWDDGLSALVKDDTRVFKGTFDGQGNTITIYVSSESTALGLFGYLYGTVQHLKVEGNITNTSTSTSSTAGIAGYNRGTISECANLAYIVGTTAGGIAGENHGIITNCYNQGNIYATGGYVDTYYYLGGITGAIDADDAEISNVYVSCRIDDVNDPGGIVAKKSKGTLSYFYYYVLLDGVYSDYHIGNVGTPITSFEGTILDGKLNTPPDDYSIWTFTEGQLPELTCFKNKIVRLSDNNDNSDILTSYNNQTCTVELSGRTLYKDGKWNTLCLPFDLTLSGSVLNGDGVVAKVLDGTNTSLNAAGLLSLTFTSVSVDSEIEAGTPFIIKWDSGTDLTNVQFSGVTIKNTDPTDPTDPTNKAVTFSNAFGDPGQFVGTYSPFSINDGNIDKIVLLSGNNTLGYSQSTRTLRSCRAHFMIPTSAGIRAMMDFDIDFDAEEVTAIANLKSQISSHKPESWFTLQGVKLDSKPTQRGIYLHNGRKEAVR